MSDLCGREEAFEGLARRMVKEIVMSDMGH